MNPRRHFHPERDNAGTAIPNSEKAARTQEAVAEGSRTVVEQAPRALGSAQRVFTNNLKAIVESDLQRLGRSMPDNARALFDKGFRIDPNIPAEAMTLQRTRSETVTSVRNGIQRGEVSARDISPSEAIPPISFDGQTISYDELNDRVKETLRVSVHGKKLQQVLEDTGMSREDAARAISNLATSIARSESIKRFIGADLLGIRSSEEKLHEKNPPRKQPPTRPKHPSTPDTSRQSIDAKTNGGTGRAPTPEENRAKAYDILGEMAKQSGVEIPVRIGKKHRAVSFIISPRHERDAEDNPIKGGDEWFEIKRAFHIHEPKNDQTEKRYEVTNLVHEGIPNGLVVRTPDDIPEAIMDGMREWGFQNSKEEAFAWIIFAGKEGERKWRDRMKIDEQSRQGKSEPAK